MSFAKDYARKLLDGRWQKKRLEILQRDGFCCTICQRQHNVQIHHNWYLKNMEPWDYNGDQLVTLCNEHHEEISELQEELKRLLASSGPEVQRKLYDYLYGLLNETKEVATIQSQASTQVYQEVNRQPVWRYCEIKESHISDDKKWVGFVMQVWDDINRSYGCYVRRQRFYIWSSDEKEAAAAKSLFSQMCIAAGIYLPRDTAELHGKGMWAFFDEHDQIVDFKSEREQDMQFSHDYLKGVYRNAIVKSESGLTELRAIKKNQNKLVCYWLTEPCPGDISVIGEAWSLYSDGQVLHEVNK